MLSLNALKKSKTIHPKEVIGKKSKTKFIGHFSADDFFRTSLFSTFLQTLQSNADGTGQRTKNPFCKCVVDLHFATINGLRESVC
jgi:hypothetical protein